jgi:transcriptional regulator with XRE-family HTH domain
MFPVSGKAFNPPMGDRFGQLSEAEAMVLFGRLIRQARFRSGMSQRQLEWVCGVDQTAISRLENGRIRHMRVQRVAAVVAGLAGYMTIHRDQVPMPERAARRLPRLPEGG